MGKMLNKIIKIDLLKPNPNPSAATSPATARWPVMHGDVALFLEDSATSSLASDTSFCTAATLASLASSSTTAAAFSSVMR